MSPSDIPIEVSKSTYEEVKSDQILYIDMPSGVNFFELPFISFSYVRYKTELIFD